MPGLIWNVYTENVNSRKIEPYNVFNHCGFSNDLSKIFREENDADRLVERVKSSLMYWFWSKCEWEVILVGWPDTETHEKIDVYDQILLNWDRFLDYILEHGRDIVGDESVFM